MKKALVGIGALLAIVAIATNFLTHDRGYVGALIHPIQSSEDTVIIAAPADVEARLATARAQLENQNGDKRAALQLIKAVYAANPAALTETAIWFARAIRSDDPDFATALLDDAYNSGRRGAAKELALMLEEVEAGSPRIAILWRQAAAEDDPWADLALAQRYADAAALERAIGKLAALHDEGQERPSTVLARLHAADGLQPDPERHEHWLHQAARRSAEGAFMLGKYLIDKPDSPDSSAEGLTHLERAAGLGNVVAKATLGRMLLFGTEPADVDHERAIALLDSAAQAGNTMAMHVYSRALFAGRGVPVNTELGAFWLYAAAEAKNAWAQADLGQRLLEGDAIDADPTEGRVWLERAAAQGNADAIILLQQPRP